MTVLKGASIALLLGTGSAHALTFDALPTVSDFNGTVVNLWFDELLATGDDSVFVISDPGTMTFDDDGTASLDMSAFDGGSALDGFRVEIEFNSDLPDNAGFKDALGRVPGVPDNIELYNIVSGTISGLGGWAGLSLAINQFVMPDAVPGEVVPVTQVGGGTGVGAANQHNTNFGMSTWFGISAVSGRDCDLCGGLASDATLLASQGDITIDLAESDVSNVSPVPVPAGVALSLTGLAILGGMGFGRRRG